ncbi:MAG: Re/Si-specific NAD(P)(+) transhydrogenase subunit alpha [Gammaproteobacteria bacterium]|nr:Re/Si-specific NAD(P)(+) transhydrogenase subunit alpha [Gammaproteobacteria bacterium]MDE2461225.1 Re/Si-specific NAD(P)(+) transhydrogenase subunit alpha [Gammaproteobacteria bacterium]
MAISVFVPKEQASGERRVAISPAVAGKLKTLGCELLLESDAGTNAGFPDGLFKDVRLVNAADGAATADVVFKVLAPAPTNIAKMKPGSVLIGLLNPNRNVDAVKALRDRKVTSFAMELVPRISRAQAMDALSSQAATAGYKAALLAAEKLGRFFPMLTTAAGTIRPAKVLVIGAGVAGLQAIATAKRLGAMVEGYDVRAAAREQVESLGAKFVDTGVSAEGSGGYARELTAEEKQKQQDALAKHVAQADAVITTAAIPGRAAPKIITTAMVDSMKPGAVIVDLAAETSGNCELTKPGEDVWHGHVLVSGPLNLPSLLAEHASEMYARNLLNFFTPLVKDGAIHIDWNDEVYAKSVLTHDGVIKHEPTRKLIET